jgi:hypothetical protein
MVEAQTFPQLPQFIGSERRFAQTRPAPVTQIWLRGQQNGLTPGGGVRKPGLLSATCPAGQQSFGLLLRRSCGQQIASVPGLIPMFPRRIGTAHFCRGGQHTCFLPVTQHERFFGQQPAFPQQRVVRLSQHLRSHSSSNGSQRLQRPVEGFAQRQFFGQHVSLPQRARPSGQRGTQTAIEGRIDLAHSSFGLQQVTPHSVSRFLQQVPVTCDAQNSPGLQHLLPQGLEQRFGVQIAASGSHLHT